MKIGILGCGYACDDYVEEVLQPWINLRKQFSTVISCVSNLFSEYFDLGIYQDNSKTLDILNKKFENREIDYLFYPEKASQEAIARNEALKPLLSNNCDIVWLLDLSDEIYSEKEIIKTIEFIQSEPFISWFKIEFKNFIFTKDTYIDGFKPPRIFRRKYNEFNLERFFWDNDVLYKNENISKNYQELPSLIIPKSVCNPLHYTWLNNERSKNKIFYQEKHFANGAGCSFKWGDNGLEWNEEYFKKTGQPKPILKKYVKQ